MAFSPFATLGFVGTNYNKVSNGDWTRVPVLGGQCVNACEATVYSCAKRNSGIEKALSKASIWCDKLAKSDKVFNGVSKTVKFIKNNINPLIVASGVTKVLLAKKEDREKMLYSEGGMITGMFLGEGWMKRNLDTKVLKKLPIEGKWAPVVKGTLFVAGSLISSTIGQKIGKTIYNYKENYHQRKLSEFEQHKNPQQTEYIA